MTRPSAPIAPRAGTAGWVASLTVLPPALALSLIAFGFDNLGLWFLDSGRIVFTVLPAALVFIAVRALAHAILQPRVTPSLPMGRPGSLFQRVFSGPNGLDPYAFTVSDVYQDLFQEGSFIGKGIYDVEVFHRVMSGRFPENAILSHDLLEACHARSALVSDVELAAVRARLAPALAEPVMFGVAAELEARAGQ